MDLAKLNVDVASFQVLLLYVTMGHFNADNLTW